MASPPPHSAGSRERIPAATAQTLTPVNFPSGIDLYQQSFVNWAQQIDIPNVWYCAPSSPTEVVTLANWAYQNGYRLRAVGQGHNWSPLVLAPGESASKIVLVNLQDSLTSISIDTSGSPVTVTVQAGATMNALLARAAGRRLRVHDRSRARRPDDRRRAGHRRARDRRSGPPGRRRCRAPPTAR